MANTSYDSMSLQTQYVIVFFSHIFKYFTSLSIVY